MSVRINDTNVSLVHVRHDGRSYGIRTEDLNAAGELTQEGLLVAVENHLDLPQGSLSGYEVDITAETENAVIRPQAKFGG